MRPNRERVRSPGRAQCGQLLGSLYSNRRRAPSNVSTAARRLERGLRQTPDILQSGFARRSLGVPGRSTDGRDLHFQRRFDPSPIINSVRPLRGQMGRSLVLPVRRDQFAAQCAAGRISENVPLDSSSRTKESAPRKSLGLPKSSTPSHPQRNRQRYNDPISRATTLALEPEAE